MGEDLDEVEEFVYLEFDDALEICGAIIDGSPAQAADHPRSREALSGALAGAHGIAETQPFVDGNKLTGTGRDPLTELTFLELNGFAVNTTDRELADWIISSSSRGSDPGVLADTLRAPLRRLA